MSGRRFNRNNNGNRLNTPSPPAQHQLSPEEIELEEQLFQLNLLDSKFQIIAGLASIIVALCFTALLTVPGAYHETTELTKTTCPAETPVPSPEKPPELDISLRRSIGKFEITDPGSFFHLGGFESHSPAPPIDHKAGEAKISDTTIFDIFMYSVMYAFYSSSILLIIYPFMRTRNLTRLNKAYTYSLIILSFSFVMTLIATHCLMIIIMGKHKYITIHLTVNLAGFVFTALSGIAYVIRV